MRLSKYEKEMLEGKHGKAKQKAMENLIKFGEAVEAEEMVSIVSAHIFAPDSTMGKIPKYDYGTGPIYEEFAELEAKVSVLTTTDPCFMQTDKFSESGYPWNYRGVRFPVECRDGMVKGRQLLDTMGIINTFSCIPYLNLSIPKLGDYHAWCESNAACYANSICGAKTNRENSITAFYAAITGVHPKHGLMCDENRKGGILFELDDEVVRNLGDISDWNALGGFIGMKAYDKIPVVTNFPKKISIEHAKALSATASPALHHPKLNLVGISPDSPTIEAAFGGKIPKGAEKIRVTLNDLQSIYEMLNTAEDSDVDIVAIGCPFLNLNEIREIASKLSGKKMSSNVAFWLQTDISTYLMAEFLGLTHVIEKAGAKIYHDTCMGNGPADKWGKVNIATNSFKNIKLFAGRGQTFLFGTLEDLVNAGVSGKFVSTRW
jgi:predicted aconitase